MAFVGEDERWFPDKGIDGSDIPGNAGIEELNSFVSNKKREISGLYTEIGKSYYTRHKNDSCAEESEKIKAVNRLMQEIYECRVRLFMLREITECRVCGKDIPADSAFCSYCGTAIRTVDIKGDKAGASAENTVPAAEPEENINQASETEEETVSYPEPEEDTDQESEPETETDPAEEPEAENEPGDGSEGDMELPEEPEAEIWSGGENINDMDLKEEPENENDSPEETAAAEPESGSKSIEISASGEFLCPECGLPLEAGYSFCVNCGMRITEEIQEMIKKASEADRENGFEDKAELLKEGSEDKTETAGQKAEPEAVTEADQAKPAETGIKEENNMDSETDDSAERRNVQEAETDTAFESPEGEKEMYLRCPECGEILEEDSIFCMNCGLRVENFVSGTAAEPKSSGRKKTEGEIAGEYEIMPETESVHEAESSPEAGNRQVAEPEDGIRRCPECGAEAEEGFSFCTECGAALE